MRFERLADWLSWQEKLHPNPIDLGLERLQRTLARLGWRRPECPVITVGGTNGKGSTVALASRILCEAGYRVGTFTSPHLVRYNERIAIDEVEVSDDALMEAFARIDAARSSDTLTFFEFNTLAALLVFETQKPDAVVLEVGMGGVLDAVNVVDADVAVITSIALDHCEWLGWDLESIGRQKAGILRANRPAIFGARSMPASIEAVAKEIGADLRRLGRDFDWQPGSGDWSWHGRLLSYEGLPSPRLAGRQQYENAAAVLAAIEALKDRLDVPRHAIDRGLETVRLSGRFQRVAGPVEWILDVAHNPAAAATLAEQLRNEPTRGTTLAVAGILGDKDIEGVVRELLGTVQVWVIAELASPRALGASALADRVSRTGASVAAVASNVVAACEAAASLARPGDRVVIFGSFLVVGPALEWLRRTGRLAAAGLIS
jgi:dihydrofolate synthase/folylpolyglutamate synthase